jgi:hypothetical protein
MLGGVKNNYKLIVIKLSWHRVLKKVKMIMILRIVLTKKDIITKKEIIFKIENHKEM